MKTHVTEKKYSRNPPHKNQQKLIHLASLENWLVLLTNGEYGMGVIGEKYLIQMALLTVIFVVEKRQGHNYPGQEWGKGLS